MIHARKLAIFDLDGTLVDAYPAIIRSFNCMMKRMKYPVRQSALIKKAVGWGDRNLIRPFVEKKDLTAALAVYRRYHAKELIRSARLLPGAKGLLQRLKAKGYKLAVASNRPGRFCRILLKHLGIGGFFDCVLCADKINKIKPHPGMIRRIVRRLKVDKRYTVFVGDMHVDAEAAKRAGVRAIILISSCCSDAALIKKQRPWRLARNIREVQRVLGV